MARTASTSLPLPLMRRLLLFDILANDADLVGAINILAAGHAVLACGGMAQSGRPAKQEPAEANMQELALV